MRRTIAIAFAVASTIAAPGARAATTEILSGTGARALQVAYYGPLGQSFTAIDTDLASFGFQFETFNPGQPNSPVSLTIRAGAGLDGSIVATRTATLPAIPATRVGTWFDFDFTGTTLMAGQAYTALLSTSSALLGLVYGPDLNIFTGEPLGGDAYAGGTIVSTRVLDTYCITSGACDTNFRFTATTPGAAVPEPAAWAMMIAGFGVVGSAMRRRARTAGIA